MKSKKIMKDFLKKKKKQEQGQKFQNIFKHLFVD